MRSVAAGDRHDQPGAEICMHLRELADGDVFDRDMHDACAQATSLLVEMRALVLVPRPANDNLEQLRWLLAKQREG